MYTLKTVRMNRQRGGITTAYLVFRGEQFIRAFHVKAQAERFMKRVNG